MPAKPDAFLSYTRFDDEENEISAFRQRLSRTVRQVSGEPFSIFQDVDDEDGIGLGERWKDRLDEMLDQARFFIPILTPSFFRSEPCRQELRTFLDLERKVGRRDLVLPIYWITCPVLEEGHLKASDELVLEIEERQRWDWRDFLFEEWKSPSYRRALHSLSSQIERARRNTLGKAAGSKSETKGLRERNSKPEFASSQGEEIQPPETVDKQKLMIRKKSWAIKKSVDRKIVAESRFDVGEVFRDVEKFWCPEMVTVPAGQFLMGSPSTEVGRNDREGPQHKVGISRPFALARFPVTFRQYDRFCEYKERPIPDDRGFGRGDRPVSNVTHAEAVAYCDALSEVTGVHYRLPTEAEWEYACRASSLDPFSVAREIMEGLNLSLRDLRFNSMVGILPPNLWGLSDMHCGIWEWCADAPRDYKPQQYTDPEGNGKLRVLRGGSVDNDVLFVRSACRSYSDPSIRHQIFGFRCARDLV